MAASRADTAVPESRRAPRRPAPSPPPEPPPPEPLPPEPPRAARAPRLLTSDDEAEVPCSDPPSSYWAEPPTPPSLEPETWSFSVGNLVFRKGCVSPQGLRKGLDRRHAELKACFRPPREEWRSSDIVLRLELRAGHLRVLRVVDRPLDISTLETGRTQSEEELRACIAPLLAATDLAGLAAEGVVEVEAGFSLRRPMSGSTGRASPPARLPPASPPPPPMVMPVAIETPLPPNSVAITARFTLRLTIDATGHVAEARLLSGPAEHARPLLDATKRWRFRPARQAGRAVQAALEFNVRYNEAGH